MKTEKNTGWLKNNYYLIIAFLLPVVILIAVYISRGIFPFGDQMYLRSDMYHQYAPFLKLFQSNLKDGSSLAYTWNIGLGSNFVSTYAYYLASPLNWIVALFPRNIIPEIMSAFIILKSGLMSATFAYYLVKKFGRRDVLATCFGVFYGLSSYMAAYSWNVMWLDCLVLFPLMVLGLEKLVKEKKYLMYTITFALAVISNYYIAIMMCIFSLIYFIYLILAEADLSNYKENLKSFGRYVLFSLVGGLIGAVIFIPAFLTLLQTASAGSTFPTTLTAYFGILEMAAHGMINVPVTMLEGYVPNIYCTVMVFALLPLYWINSKISLRQRAGKSLLLLFMAVSFAFNVLAFIWHGFHFPNSLPSRQSFIYIFLILTVGYEVMMKIRQYSYKAILICFGIGVAAVFALQQLYKSDDIQLSVAYISAAFIAGYCLIAIMIKYKKIAIIIPMMALLVVTVAEATINTDKTGYGTSTRDIYVGDNQSIDEALASIDDTDFYRVEKVKRRTKNDAAWSGYRSASIFSSVTNKEISDLYGSFGLQHGTNSFSHYGNTPLTSSILGVRYRLSEEALDDPLLVNAGSFGELTLYQNPYALPLGFMVEDELPVDDDANSGTPFEFQNSFLQSAKGILPVFEEGQSLTGKEVTYTVTSNDRLFFYVDRKIKDFYIKTEDEEGTTQSISNTECNMLFDAGYHSPGDVLIIGTSDEEAEEFTLTPAYMDEYRFENAMSALSDEPLNVTEFTDTTVKGTVSAAKDGALFTTIPYEKGWEVKVDGNIVDTADYNGAFVKVPLSAGRHEVEFAYHVPGFIAGVLISLGGVAFLIVFTVLAKKRQKKANNP